jgi:lipopolysaccharide heptosyltransferase I
MNILMVRLGALGDVVHAIPAAAALRAAFPDARLHWLVEAKHRAILDLVTVLDAVVTVDARTVGGWIEAIKRLRQTRYDIALDFQGLMKSAVFARASGAPRVAGFSIWHLREKTARPLYSETGQPPDDEDEHVIRKNLRLLRVLGVDTTAIEFPLAHSASPAADAVARDLDGQRFALINPGAAWPNKRWPAQRFGEIAAYLREVRGLPSVVLWGPGEQALAAAVAAASNGAAQAAPPTEIADLVELSRRAAVIVSGDTGPLHIAAAVRTPVVAIYGPTNPHRNGPWSAADVSVSRFESCGCHYERKCHEAAWCLDGVGVAEVTAAIQQRLSAEGVSRRPDRAFDA